MKNYFLSSLVAISFVTLGTQAYSTAAQAETQRSQGYQQPQAESNAEAEDDCSGESNCNNNSGW